MQINGVSSSDNLGNWAAVAAQSAVSAARSTGTDSSDDTAMVAESNPAVDAVTDSKKDDTLKTTADKSHDLKNKDDKDKKENTNNKAIVLDNTQLKFKVHKGTGEIMIQVVDNDTGKVIREIPPESILDAIAKIWKTAGINVDKKI